MFTEDLRARRVAAGFTQTDLAEKVGLSQTMIYDYEAGRWTPSHASFARLAELLPGLEEPSTFHSDEPGARQGAPGNWHGHGATSCAIDAEGKFVPHRWWVSRAKKVRVCDVCPAVEVRT